MIPDKDKDSGRPFLADKNNYRKCGGNKKKTERSFRVR